MKKTKIGFIAVIGICCWLLLSACEVRNNGTMHEMKYSDEQLCKAAGDFYYAKYGYLPSIVEVDRWEEDKIVIHLYDWVDNHTATCDWYTVNCYGKGNDFGGRDIDLIPFVE